MTPDDCCILNAGGGAWAFEGLARDLSDALWIDVAETPRRFNYLLCVDWFDPQTCGELFIPFASIQIAADKRLLADVFNRHRVPRPETHLLESLDAAQRFVAERSDREWCLKYPTGCGASGHRMFRPGQTLPASWPFPLVVQEFVRLERPEVYRIYAAGGELFGWNARRFPPETDPSPWVAHARGARYEILGQPPSGAVVAAEAALRATGLLDSFGAADLLRRPSGEWIVLEVGTDGMFNHVDRNLEHPALEREIGKRIAEAFWKRAGGRPWAPGEWRPLSES